MSRRRALVLGSLSTFFALLLTVAAQPAHAYTQRTYVTVAKWDNLNICVQATAGIDHFKPGVFSGNQAWGTAYAFASDCVTRR